MKKVILGISITFLGMSCLKEELYEGPDFYEDDFENYSVLDDLLEEDDLFWSFAQITKTENTILVDSSHSHSGAQSLRFYAQKSTDDQLSKCSIVKQKMAFWEGETIRVSTWYYLEDTLKLDWLFLMDIEEQAPISAGPGMRLALVDNQLRVEHKFYESDIRQDADKAIDFPRNQWVKIVWEIKLSQKNKGAVRLWQDDKPIISTENNRTLPNDLLYAQQGTKGMYSSVEVGITANSFDNETVLWVDEVKIERVE